MEIRVINISGSSLEEGAVVKMYGTAGELFASMDPAQSHHSREDVLYYESLEGFAGFVDDEVRGYLPVFADEDEFEIV